MARIAPPPSRNRERTARRLSSNRSRTSESASASRPRQPPSAQPPRPSHEPATKRLPPGSPLVLHLTSLIYIRLPPACARPAAPQPIQDQAPRLRSLVEGAESRCADRSFGLPMRRGGRRMFQLPVFFWNKSWNNSRSTQTARTAGRPAQLPERSVAPQESSMDANELEWGVSRGHPDRQGSLHSEEGWRWHRLGAMDLAQRHRLVG